MMIIDPRRLLLSFARLTFSRRTQALFLVAIGCAVSFAAGAPLVATAGALGCAGTGWFIEWRHHRRTRGHLRDAAEFMMRERQRREARQCRRCRQASRRYARTGPR